MRKFETGATRDTDDEKLNYRRFFCPLVLKRRAEYMQKHRIQADGQLREPDNWKKGMPLEAYADSAWRHHWEFWSLLDADITQGESVEEALCALMFNAEGYLHELLKEQTYRNQSTSGIVHRVSECTPEAGDFDAERAGWQ